MSDRTASVRLPAVLRLLGVTAAIVIAAAIFDMRIRMEMIDFVTWQQAVVRALHAAPLYLHDVGHYQFKYLPAFALLMAPFGMLSAETGKLFWFATEVCLLVILLRWSIAALPGQRLASPLLATIVVVLMAKFYAHEVVLGQANLLLAVLLIGALMAVQAERPFVAGAIVGLAMFVKPYALVMLPWLVVTQGVLSGLATLGVIGVGLILPAMVYGWSGNLQLLSDWFRTVTETTAPLLLNSDNVSIAAMWAKWIGPGQPATVLAWVTIAATVVLVLATLRRRRSVRSPEYLECALLMLLVPLISPQGWDYVLLLATPAVMCIVDRARDLTAGWRWGLGLALATMGLTIFDIMGRALYGRFMALSLVSVCALAIAAGLVHVRWRRLA